MPWQNQSGGPWGGNNRGGGRGSNSNGNGSGNNDNRSPENPWGGNVSNIDDLIKRSKERFGSGGGGGQGSSNGGGLPPIFKSGRMIGLGVIVLFGLWLFSGFYQVETGTKGIVKTFGEFTSVADEGLNWHIPYPIQSVDQVSTARSRSTNIGFRGGSRSGKIDNPEESLMLTGDQNIVDIDLTVLWRISVPQDYLFNIRNPEQTVKIAAESALREIIGRAKIVDALTSAKNAIQNDAKTLLQSTLDTYQAGILIENVQLQHVLPPNEVADSFDDVQRAIQDRDTQQNQANQYLNRIIQEAQGESERIRKGADAYRERLINEAEGEAQRFTDVYAAYQSNPDVTRRRLYLETMEEVFRERGAIIVDSALQNGTIIINTNEGAGSASATGGQRILPVPSGN